MTKCVIVNCNNPSAPALKRGLCMRCYSRAKNCVDQGAATWNELVHHGLALSIDDAGGDPFTAALKIAKENSDNAVNT